MGISRSLISRFESGEKSGTIKLDTLKRTAEAMDCTLVYAFVPNGESYKAVLDNQAHLVASGPSERVLHTMSLEGQRPDIAGAARVRDQITADIIGSGRVWDS
jgi:predicted DNA-binding mobile mystery protein A